MAIFRLNKVAKEFNVGIQTLVEYLAKKGYEVEQSPNTKIDEEQYELLVAAFNEEEKREELEQDILPPADSPFTVVGNVELSEIHQRPRPVIKKKIETNGTREAYTPDFIETQYTKLEGPHQLDKIDLSQFDISNYNTRSGIFSEGDIVAVKVTGIQNYGAFVQIKNGPSGLIHNSEISWNRVQNAADFVSVGDELLAKIIKINDDGKLALSRKEMLPNARTVQPGEVLSGIITEEKEFGFIVKFGDFTSLLLNKDVHPDLYEVGDSIKCVVTENLFDEEKHRNKIYISERKTHETFSSEHHIGEHIVCNIEKIKHGEEGKHKIVVSYGNIKCLIPEKRLIEPYNDELKNGKIRRGQKIEIVYKAYYEKTSTVILDMRPILKEQRVKFASTHTIGEHVLCDVLEVKDIEDSKYVIVSCEGIICTVPEKNLIEPFRELLRNGDIQNGQSLEFVFSDYHEGIGRVTFDMRPILKEREEEKIRAFHSSLTKGDVIDAEVLSVMGKEAELLLIDGDIKIRIPKDELSPNKVLNAADEVFVGERIKVQYMGDEAERMIFSRRHLEEDIYDDELYDMDVDQLLSNMGFHTRRFVGKATLINDNYFITNLMSVDNVGEEDNGKLLIDPVNGKNLVAIVDNKLRNRVSEGEFCEVELNVSTSNYRRKQGTPYQFCVVSPSIKEVHNPYEESVMLSFKKQTSPSSNTSLANLLEEVGLNLYSGKKRMFFELLQNADDAAAQNGVKVKVQMNGEYFTLTHDGYSFNKHDFDSIISAAKSTKSANKKKTGYKGIGFKSVFTSSTLVSIKSGGYTFSFDKDLEEYNDFSKFYFHVNDIETDTAKQAAFLRKYEKEAREFNGVKDIPWQLLPIWADKMTIPYTNSIFNRNENVGIALKMDKDTLSEYHKAVLEVFADPRFMLFLRKTKRVQLIEDDECLTIQKNISKNGELVTLVNSFNPERRSEDFRIYSVEDIPVNDVAFEEAGVRIKREERINTRGEKEFYYVLVGADGELLKEITGVPDRIASATDTTISYAIKLDEGRHISPTDSKDSSFYAYLPMNENRFSFPFYINADFIPNSDRERINSENPWNHFLFYLLGKSLVKMVSDMASADEPQYLNLLCKEALGSEGQDTSQMVTAFNKGYSEALSQVPYILDDEGNKVSSSYIVYDDSGLSEAIGHEAFYALLGSERKLPHPMVDAKILKNGVFGVAKLSVADVVKSLTDNILVVKQWIPSADESIRANLFEWITQKKIANPLAEIVPAYEFSDGWKAHSELTEKTIILSESTALLRDELENLGYMCSVCLYENHPFHDYISVPSKKKLFSMIKECDITSWSFENRKNLFQKVVEILNQEVGSVSEWNIFKNQEGQFCHLSQMFQYSAGTPSWLYPYMVEKSEYWEGLDAYLIPTENVFSKIVTPNIDAILTKANIVEIYDVFSQKWQPVFTKQLFSKNIPQNQMLYIVEQSTDTIKVDYIKHLDKLELFSDREYRKDSNEYRIVNIAAEKAPATIKGKIYIDGLALSKYVLKNEVSIPYIENKTFTFLLSDIIPSYSTASVLSKVSENFNDIPAVEKVFEQQESDPITVRNELVLYLTNNRYISTVTQFCFMMVYTAVRGNHYHFDSSIAGFFRITKTDEFLALLDKCFQLGAGKILGGFFRSPYVGNAFSNIKVDGLYINCDEYTLPKERVPEYVKNWADTDEKKKFLLELGVHDAESKEILRRKSFKDCKLENIWNITDNSIINYFLEWVMSSISLPVSNENQVTILKGLCQTIIQRRWSPMPCKISYVEDDISDAVEWSDALYQEWKKKGSVSIWLMEKPIQHRMYYGSKVLYKDGEDDFWYFPTSRRVYISSVKGRTPAVIMADVYSKSSMGWPFTKDDWDKIFLVSVDKYQELESTKEELEAEIRRLRGLLDDAYGAEVERHGKDIEKGTLSDIERKEINREARYAAKEFLEQNEDFDCSDWDPDESGHLISGLVKFKGNPITVAVTSSLARKLYLHPRVFAELMQNPDNVLLNYGADKMIHSLSFDDVFSDNPNVNLIFDTDVVSPQRIAELANDFMGSKRTCFVVENPNYSQSDRIKHFGLNEKKSGFVAVDFTDDEIFDF